MALTKSEIKTLKSIEKDALSLAKHAKRVAAQAKSKLLREMRKS